MTRKSMRNFWQATPSDVFLSTGDGEGDWVDEAGEAAYEDAGELAKEELFWNNNAEHIISYKTIQHLGKGRTFYQEIAFPRHKHFFL